MLGLLRGPSDLLCGVAGADLSTSPAGQQLAVREADWSQKLLSEQHEEGEGGGLRSQNPAFICIHTYIQTKELAFCCVRTVGGDSVTLN